MSTRLASAARPNGETQGIETRASWVVAAAALGILSVSYGAPLVAAVALKPIAADLDVSRATAALAGSLTWLGAGAGGIFMGWLADRIGVRFVVAAGALMGGAGLLLSASGGLAALLVGHGLLLGLLGNSAMLAPISVYVSRWFDRRRGAALALISSGQYVAGVVWPMLFERGLATVGWRATMVLFGTLDAAVIVPAALLLLGRTAPEPHVPAGPVPVGVRGKQAVLGLRPNTVLAALSVASFCCCVPMAMPATHLVAYCGDLGIAATQGAGMLSVMLGAAFAARQVWGWITDRIGGLSTVLAASVCQAIAMTGFLLTQDEAGLFAVSAAFGLGFSGLIPAYIVAIRELFPAREAGWRVPVMLFLSTSGMAFGSWLAGALYDGFGFYAPAFAAGVLFNLFNLAIIGTLVLCRRTAALRPALG